MNKISTYVLTAFFMLLCMSGPAIASQNPIGSPDPVTQNGS